MGVKVSLKNGENFQSLMKRFKRICEGENILRDYKKRGEFEKPSSKRRREKFRRIKNAKKHEIEMENNRGQAADGLFQW